MTGAEIREAAQLNLGVTINSAVSLKYLNEAVEKIVESYKEKAGKIATKSIAVTDYDDYYELDADMVKVVGVYNSSGGWINSKSYAVENDTIKMDYKDTFTVKYRKYPDALTVETSTPDIPRQFHRAIAAFVSYKEALRLYGSSHSDTGAFYKMYYSDVKSAAAMITTRKPRHIKAAFND
jgi:hypothetical protein